MYGGVDVSAPSLHRESTDSLMVVCSYKGHKNNDYKLDSCLTHDDAHIVSGSEDGRVCFWDLVEVGVPHTNDAFEELEVV